MKPSVSAALAAMTLSLTFTSGALSQAAPGAKKPVANATSLITLGTRGGPLPTRGRTQSSNLLVVNGTLYLIDAGDGATRHIVKAGYDFRRIGKIFITHPHSDHTNGLATLLNAQWEYQRREPTDIYGGGVEALVKGAIAYLTPNAEIRWSEGKRQNMAELFHGHDVAPGAVYQDENVHVTAVENTHFNFPPDSPGHGKYRSYAYRFDTPGRVIVFTGDTGPSEALTQLAKGADLLVSEVTVVEDVIEVMRRNGVWLSKSASEQAAWMRHMEDEHVTPEQVGRMASAAGVKRVVLTHLSPTVDRKDDYQRYAVEVRKFFTGPVAVASDFSRF
jgi:ribonuclease BN (tRNA processing enzyme)